VFPVRYGLDFYINLLRNSVFKGLMLSIPAARSRYSAPGRETRLLASRQGSRGYIPGRDKRFFSLFLSSGYPRSPTGTGEPG
jgi:hypothetical protein